MKKFTILSKFHCDGNLKSVVRILLSIAFFVVYMVGVLAYGQNYQINDDITSDNPTEQKDEFAYMQIHKQYKWQLNPLSLVNNYSIKNSTDELSFFMDTVYVYSVSSSPKRYVNNYTLEGYIESTTKQLLETSGWVNVSLQEFVYDNEGNKINWLWKAWQDGNWESSSRNTYTYSGNNHMLTSLNEIWENEIWENNSRNEFSYDVGGKTVYHLNEIWADTGWAYVSQEFYTYDNSGNMLTATGELWTIDVWRNDQKHTYTYDANNNMITGLSETWFNGEWINTFNESFTYNTINKRLTYLIENWNDSVWANSQFYTYSYNTLDLLEIRTAQIWEIDDWVNTENGQYTYTSYNGIENSLIKHWLASEWINHSLTQYEYDEYGNALTGEYFNWDGNTWVQNQEGLLQLHFNYCTETVFFIGYLAESHYISFFVGINENISTSISHFICSPNPANTNTTINIELTKEEFVDIDLYSISGKKIQDIVQGELLSGKHAYTISTNEIPSGTYFIALQSSNTTKTIKLLITK